MSRNLSRRFGASAVLLTAVTVGLIAACSNVESDRPANAQAANQADDEKAPDKAAAVGEFDIVILNGRVMDPETKFDGVRNVGIKDGKIVSITEKAITGKETINAKGLVVAPGFIDTEQHGLTDWGIKVNLRDGVTTQMDFEVGALNITEWYAKRDGKLQATFGAVVGQDFARKTQLRWLLVVR